MQYSEIKIVEPMISELRKLGGFSIVNKNDNYISIRVRDVSKDKCNEYYQKYDPYPYHKAPDFPPAPAKHPDEF